MTTWNNVPGTCTINFYRDSGVWYVENTIRPTDYYAREGVPRALCATLSNQVDDNATLIINFKSSGSHTPMSMYGGPDRLGWPEEHDDERLLEDAYLNFEEYDGKNYIDKKVSLTREVQEEVFELFIEEVYDTEPDWPDED